MGEHALTVRAVRDGPVCALILSGDLGLTETSGSWGRRPWPSITGSSGWSWTWPG
jgi:hypothetical protein